MHSLFTNVFCSISQNMQNMLKGAWDAEGSPFKGQPFDPSKFSMDSNGMVTIKPDNPS